MRISPILCGFLVLRESTQIKLNFFIFPSETISSTQPTIIKKEKMDITTTNTTDVKEESVSANSSKNANLGDPANSLTQLVSDVSTPPLNLDNLSSVVQESTIPMEEETTLYLQQVASLKKVNAEHALLNVLDEIIDMTVCGKIGNSDIETDIPDSIIASIHQDNFVAEYIHSSVTKKWVEHRFQQDAERYTTEIKSKTLVQVTDNALKTFDLFGLYIQHSTTQHRNRIQPEFVTKNESLQPRAPRQNDSYSAFRTVHPVKKPFLPVLPAVQTVPSFPEPPQKVSRNFTLILHPIFFLDISSKCRFRNTS